MAAKPKTDTAVAPVTSWRKLAESSEDVQKYNAFKVKLDLITVEKDFNPRDMSKPTTLTKIANIKKAYLQGDEVPPLECQLMDDGRVQVVDGHCRLTAAHQARAEQRAANQPEIEYLIVMPFRGNDLDRLVMAFTANEGEKLTPLECGELCKRLMRMHWDKKRIAEKFNFTLSWLDRILFLADMPEAVKLLVNHDKVAADVALKVVKTAGAANAEAELLRMLDDAAGKLTKKHLKPKEEPAPTVATPREEPVSGPVEVTSNPEPEQTLVEKWDETFNKPAADITEKIAELNAAAGAAPAPAAKPAKKAKGDPMEVAIRLAQHLPQLELIEEHVMGNWEYDIKVSGHAYRALLQLQALLKNQGENNE